MSAPSWNEIAWSTSLAPAAPPLTDEWRKILAPKFGKNIPDEVVAITRCPWLLGAMGAFDGLPLVHISHELRDLIQLVVSQDNSCRYCYGATRAMLRLTGHSEQHIRSLETELHRSDLSQVDRLALDFARLVSRASPRAGTSEMRALREAGLSDGAIVEIALTASLQVFNNRFATMLAMSPDPVERLVDVWYAPLVSLVVRFQVAKRRKRTTPVPMPSEAKSGPLSTLFTALDGQPGGAALFAVASSAMASPILPLRTKVLLMAVVGRTLSCPVCEVAAGAVFHGLGNDVAILDEVLRRLASPQLDPLEAQLVPLARDTVRYQQPMHLQEKMRALSAAVSPEQFLEFVGMCALANTIGRLTIVLGLA